MEGQPAGVMRRATPLEMQTAERTPAVSSLSLGILWQQNSVAWLLLFLLLLLATAAAAAVVASVAVASAAAGNHPCPGPAAVTF